jgi:hypothetical protein
VIAVLVSCPLLLACYSAPVVSLCSLFPRLGWCTVTVQIGARRALEARSTCQLSARRMQGGVLFIATQVASWTFCALVVLSLVHIGTSVTTTLSHVHPWLVAAGTVLAPLSLSASAAVFNICSVSKRTAPGMVSKHAYDVSAVVCVCNRCAALNACCAGSTADCSVHTSLLHRFLHAALGTCSLSSSKSYPCLAMKRNCSATTSTHSGRLCCRALALASLYLPGHVWFLCLVVPFVVFSEWRAVVAVQALVHGIYVWSTTRGQPSLSGCRYWPAAVNWMRRNMGPAYAWWMRECEVREG